MAMYFIHIPWTREGAVKRRPRSQALQCLRRGNLCSLQLDSTAGGRVASVCRTVTPAEGQVLPVIKYIDIETSIFLIFFK